MTGSTEDTTHPQWKSSVATWVLNWILGPFEICNFLDGLDFVQYLVYCSSIMDRSYQNFHIFGR